MDKFFPQMLTPDEVAEILKITPNQMNHLLNTQKIKFVSVGVRTRRITMEGLQEFIEKNTISKPGPIDPAKRLALKSEIVRRRKQRSLKIR